MRTSELHKGQPIFAFLGPSGANTAPLSQPTKCPFHDPSSCWMFLVFRNWFWQGFAATPSVSNVFLIIGFGNKMVDIVKIIPFIQTKMLFFCRTWNHNGENKVINRPFVVLVSAGKMHGQRCASLIDQDMDLGTAFTSVSGIASRCFSAQRCRDRFAVDRLPFPTNSALPIVKANHRLQHPVPDTLLLPGLEPFVQNTAGNAEPSSMDCFPLAASPQNVPEAVDNCPIVSPGSPWPASWRGFGQVFFDATPQRPRDTEIVDILGFLFILVFQDAPRWTFVFGQTNCPQGASFV